MTALMPRPQQRTVRGDERPSERSEGRILLSDVSWETYLALRETESNNAVRMTYDEGRLELVSPSSLHERITWLWGRFVTVWTEELGLLVDSRRSTTFRPAQRRQGFEADDCFYIENEPAVRARDRIDLAVDPPPDLGLEIDVTSPSIPKLPLYAAIRVPEVWIWRADRVRVLRLQEDGTYSEVVGSFCLPGFPFDEVLRLLDQRFEIDSNTLMRRFREWIRANRRDEDGAPESLLRPTP